MIGFIYDGVKRAINDAIPGAIKSALGWHSNTWDEQKTIVRKIRTGYMATPVGELVVSGNMDEIQPPRENKIEPVYKKEKILLKITHHDQIRFNPVTGDYDVRKDDSPMVEELSREIIGD
jgi:hypothetical protein